VNRTLTGLLASLLICLTGCASVAPDDHQLRGRIVAIADGDTLTLLDASKGQHKIRLDGIDAPESGPAVRQSGEAVPFRTGFRP